MIDSQIRWYLQQDWNDEKGIKASEIAEFAFSIAILSEESTLRKLYYMSMLTRISSLDEIRREAVKEAFYNIKEKKIQEEEDAMSPAELLHYDLPKFEERMATLTEEERNEVMIRINLGELYDDFKESDGSLKIRTSAEAFTVAANIMQHTTGSSKRILDTLDMKDTNHHNRDLQTKKRLNDSDFIQKPSTKECSDNARDYIKKTLLSDGVYKKRATRLATNTITIIRKINKNI